MRKNDLVVVKLCVDTSFSVLEVIKTFISPERGFVNTCDYIIVVPISSLLTKLCSLFSL